jgi:hypothetical protein
MLLKINPNLLVHEGYLLTVCAEAGGEDVLDGGG